MKTSSLGFYQADNYYTSVSNLFIIKPIGCDTGIDYSGNEEWQFDGIGYSSFQLELIYD